MRTPTPLPIELRTGPFTNAQARRHGVGGGRLRAADLHRPFRGVRSVEHPIGPVGLAEAFAHRMTRKQFLSHESAAALWGIPLPAAREASSLVHVSVLAGGNRPRAAGVRGHVLAPGAVGIAERNGIRLTDPVTTWRLLGATLDLDDVVAAADYLITGTSVIGGDPALATLDELRAEAARSGVRGAVVLRAAIELARVGPLSRAESRLRLGIVRAGLPEPVPNLPIHGPYGELIAMIDLAYPEQHVGIEYQSDFHADPHRMRKDLARLEVLADLGWVIVQVTAADVVGLRRTVTFERIARRLAARA